MRLTKKQDKKNYPYVYDSFEDYFEGEPINKLGQLEDIEEELGIDLITLSKILKNGCYVKPWKAVLFSKEMTLRTTDGELKLFDEWDNDYSLCNYGVDFALTKEELTNGK